MVDDTADRATDTNLAEMAAKKAGKTIVIACFDDDTAAALLAHRTAIARLGAWEASAWPPHITLGAYEGLDATILCEWVRLNAARHPAFETHLSSFAVFPRQLDSPDTAVLFVAPASTPALIALYYHLHERYDEFHDALGWLYSLQYGHPVLHATVAAPYPHAAMPAALAYMLDNFVEIVAQIVALEVYSYPMQLLARFPLREGQG